MLVGPRLSVSLCGGWLGHRRRVNVRVLSTSTSTCTVQHGKPFFYVARDFTYILSIQGYRTDVKKSEICESICEFVDSDQFCISRYPLTGYTRIQNVELLDLFVQLHTAGEQLGKCQNILKHG